MMAAPALTTWLPWIQEMLSAAWISVEGECSANDGPLKFEYPEMETSGMPLRKLPVPAGKMYGNVKP